MLWDGRTEPDTDTVLMLCLEEKRSMVGLLEVSRSFSRCDMHGSQSCAHAVVTKGDGVWRGPFSHRGVLDKRPPSCV